MRPATKTKLARGMAYLLSVLSVYIFCLAAWGISLTAHGQFGPAREVWGVNLLLGILLALGAWSLFRAYPRMGLVKATILWVLRSTIGRFR